MGYADNDLINNQEAYFGTTAPAMALESTAMAASAASTATDVGTLVDVATLTPNCDTAPYSLEGTAVAASADIGAGENGVVTTTALTKGTVGNGATGGYTIEVVEGSAGGALAAAIDGTDITVTLGMDSGTSSTAAIGAGENGVVTTTVDAVGVAGDSYTIEVVEGVGADVDLSVDLTATAITVTLGTDSESALDATKNTATLVAAAISTLTGVTATASGDGSTAIGAAEGPTSFSGGADVAPDDAKNTATLIAAAVDALDGVSAAASGTGATAISAAEGPTNFTGGANGSEIVIPLTAGAKNCLQAGLLTSPTAFCAIRYSTASNEENADLADAHELIWHTASIREPIYVASGATMYAYVSLFDNTALTVTAGGANDRIYHTVLEVA